MTPTNSERHGVNSKRPDVSGIAWSRTALRCKGCKQIIRIGRLVKVRVSYNFYYDHCDFYHLLCRMPREMFLKPTEAV